MLHSIPLDCPSFSVLRYQLCFLHGSLLPMPVSASLPFWTSKTFTSILDPRHLLLHVPLPHEVASKAPRELAQRVWLLAMQRGIHTVVAVRIAAVGSYEVVHLRPVWQHDVGSGLSVWMDETRCERAILDGRGVS